ncbi:MAG: cupin domain-containing protein [Candidatus Omnitrophica bacterium]|nr:cupin domain-containing protein [Candidatus Omnitrophota bacterium]MDE2008842.1 cupin domain-containing protein [Candidatus Omnitrophota bacterium]MDE2213595.1 cupin domain-containing protein [Candidatus Omnitrophota bacterium]MDE2230504.1 cupin domain-containing protein [Candidatus Omnitrophota bacterium]
MDGQGFHLNLKDHMVFSKEGIYSKVIAKSATYNFTLMCLSKGTDIDTHTSTKNGCVYVLKGKGTFILFDEEILMKEGVCIFMPANAPHALRADEDLAILLSLSV